MNCRVCGGRMEALTTDLPFKLSRKTIVIVRELPVHQCGNCAQFLLDDAVMARVDQLLTAVDRSTELEVVRFAA